MIPIGIDLGTATSEIAAWQDGAPLVLPDPDSPVRSPIVPSILAVDRRGRLVVGETARAYPDGVRQFKRRMGEDHHIPLGTEKYRPQELSAQILRHLKANAEIALGTEIRQAVISVPANFAEAARKATHDAAELAGLQIARLINEPTAAALAFGVKKSNTEGRVAVFDFGGGTLDVTVLEMMEGILEVKASYGDPLLGGTDFDKALMELLRERFRKEHPGAVSGRDAEHDLRNVAEATKISLSRRDEALARCANYAVEGGRPVDLEIEVTRRDLERVTRGLLDKARECLSETLRRAGTHKDEIQHVLLVGGTTYIPAVRTLVAEFFGREPRQEVNPDLAVAQGAAIEAALISGDIPAEKGIVKTDVASYGLGVGIAGWVGRHLLPDVYDSLMDPNTTIPYSVKRRYSLLHPEQPCVRLTVYQDHEGTARMVADAVETGLVAEIPDIPASPTGMPHPVEVDFSYDLNGLIKLRARIPTTGQEKEVITFRDGERGPVDATKAEALWKRTPLARRHEPLLARAEKAIPNLRPDDRKGVHEAIAALQKALAEGDERAVDRAADKLTDLLFDLQD